MSEETKPQVKRHQQFILGIAASYFQSAADWQLPVTPYNADKFIEEAEEHLVIRQRLGLESDTSVRQALPYMIPKTFAYQGKPTMFFPYVRGDGVGEVNLIGKVSIGYGGHVDGKDTHWEKDSRINLKNTLLHAAMRERFEELEPDDMHYEVWTNMMPEMSNLFIASNLNDTDKAHLGIIIELNCPPEMELTCREEELTGLGKMTAEQLLTSGYDLENWTRLYLEWFVANPQGEAAKPYVGFGNESDKQEKQIVERTALDEAIAVLYVNFPKGAECQDMPEFKIVQEHAIQFKDSRNLIFAASRLVEAIEYPKLADTYRDQVIKTCKDYLETRFSPDEMEEFAAGLKTLVADKEALELSDKVFTIITDLVQLKAQVYGEQVLFKDYGVKIKELELRLKLIPSVSYSEPLVYAGAQFLLAHSSAFELIGQHLDDHAIPVRALLHGEPTLFENLWTEAEEKVRLLFKPMDEVIAHLAENKDLITALAQQRMSDDES